MDFSFYRGKKVFVTGHTGFKGTWLCRVLLALGADVTGYALDPPTDPSLFSLTRTAKDMRSVRGDVRDFPSLLAAAAEAKPEIVFHLAAQPIVRLSYRTPEETFATNVMGTVNVLGAVRRTESVGSAVLVTTDKVYRGRESGEGYREDDELGGGDPYAGSKSCCELAVSSYRASFFSASASPAVSTARSGNAIGGGDRGEDRIIPDCVRSALRGEKARLRDPSSVRPYQHVLSCLSGYLLLAEKQESDPVLAGAYNFGPGGEKPLTTGALADLFCRFWGEGAGWEREGKEEGPPEAHTLLLDSSKARRVLGWESGWDTREAVRKTVDWEKAVRDGEDPRRVTDRQIASFFSL